MPTDRDSQRELEEIIGRVGRDIASRLPPCVGMTMMLFHYGEGTAGNGFLAYFSTAQREDMIRSLRETLKMLEAGINRTVGDA